VTAADLSCVSVVHHAIGTQPASLQAALDLVVNLVDQVFTLISCTMKLG